MASGLFLDGLHSWIVFPEGTVLHVYSAGNSALNTLLPLIAYDIRHLILKRFIPLTPQ